MSISLGIHSLPAQSNITNLILPHVPACYPGSGLTVTDLASKNEYTFFSPAGQNITSGASGDSLIEIATESASSGYFTFGKSHKSLTHPEVIDREWATGSSLGNAKISLNASQLILDGTDAQGKDPKFCFMIWIKVPNLIGDYGIFDLSVDDTRIHMQSSTNNVVQYTQGLLRSHDGFNFNNPQMVINGNDLQYVNGVVMPKDEWVCIVIQRHRFDYGNQGNRRNSTRIYSPTGYANSSIDTNYHGTKNYFTIDSVISGIVGDYYSDKHTADRVFFHGIDADYGKGYGARLSTSVNSNFDINKHIKMSKTGTDVNVIDREDTLYQVSNVAVDSPMNDLGNNFIGDVGAIIKWDRNLTKEEVGEAYNVFRRFYRKANIKNRKCTMLDRDGLPIMGSDYQPIETTDVKASPFQITRELSLIWG